MCQITIITGPMFCGKTTELIRLFSREEIANRKSFIFKPKMDNRYQQDFIVNHMGQKTKAINISNEYDILEYIDNYNKNNLKKISNIFIDEVQFFNSNIIDVIKKVTNQNINVYVSCLNQTFEGLPFPFNDNKEHIGYLLAISDFIVSLNSICNKCGAIATKSYRLDNKKQKNTILLGGKDKYQARCTKCFKE